MAQSRVITRAVTQTPPVTNLIKYNCGTQAPLAVGPGACCRQRAELGVGQGQGDGGTEVFPCEVEELEVVGDSWQTTVLLARQPGVEVEWLEEAGDSWKAMLLAARALLQLGKLLTMHAGGVAAGTWRLLRRRWKHCALSRCSVTVLCHCALSLCSVIVLYHCALSLCPTLRQVNE